MKKEKSKVNFQRFGCLLFACLFVLFPVIAFTPALAATFSYPEALQPWLNVSPLGDANTLVTFGLTQTGSYSLSSSVPVSDGYVTVNSVYYSTLFGIPQYEFRYNGETFATQAGYPLVIEVDPEYTDSSLLQTVRYLYSTDYQFASFVDQEFSVVVLYNYDSTVFSGILTGMWNSGDFQLMFSTEDSEPLIVYSNGLWVDDFYRSPVVIVPVTRASFAALNNSRFTPSFLDRLSSGFTAAIGWLGDFFTSLFTGNLVLAFVLVSVGFGLALLSFGFRWIRRLLWAY